MRLIHLIAILCISLLTINCSGPAANTTQNDSVPLKASIAVTDRVINTVSPMIFGDNIEWTNDGMGLWLPDEKKFDEKLVEEFRAVGVTHLRYPGGTLSDYFDWYKAVGKDRLPITNPFNQSKKEYPFFGPEEFMMLCRKLDIPGTITLNAGTGTPEDAAGWVKYLKENNFKVADFTVGNEIYLSKPEEPVFKTSEQYVDFYLKCKDAIQKVAPDVKIGAIGLHDTGPLATLFNLSRSWMKDVLSKLGNDMDFIDIHNAYAPITRGVGLDPDKMYPDDEFAQCFMGASTYVRDNIAATKDDLAKYAPDGGKNIEIHITEYGPLVYPIKQSRAFDDVAWNRTLTGALYLACLFNVFLEEPKITNANHLPLCQDIFGALIRIQGNYPERKFWRNIVYYVFQMYSSMAGREVMEITAESPVYSSPVMGVMTELKDVPYVDSGAYRTKDGNKLAIFLINRDVKREANVDINTGFNTFRIDSITTLTASDYKAENSPEKQENVAPIIKIGDKSNIAGIFTTVLPKHSLTVIEFVKM